MTVVAFTLSGKSRPQVRVFASAKDARNAGNGWSLYESAEKIASDFRKVSPEDMLELYNSVAPPAKRWKSTDAFPTRIEGALALWEAIMNNVPVTSVDKGDSEMAKAKAKKAAPKDAPKERKPRESENAGKRLIAKVKMEDTKLREGSERGKSFKIIESAGKRGITYEDYVEKGGTPLFVNWFKNDGRISVA